MSIVMKMSWILSHCARSKYSCIFIRYVNAHHNIRWTHTRKNMASNCVVFHFSPIWPTWPLAVISHMCQPITHLQLFTLHSWEDTLKKCRLSMSLRVLQSGCNYLKLVLSQHLTKQFQCLHKVHFSKSSYLGKILAILRICDNEKKSVW